MKALQNLKQRYIYSKETYQVLNNFTLQIKDKIIEQEYAEFRMKKFNNTFWPQVGLYVLFSTRGWL